MKINYTLREECRVCPTYGGTKTTLIPLITLPDQPLADSFVEDPIKPKQAYPLKIGVCPQCKLVQHQVIIPDDVLFGNDYAFFTGASPSSVKYFETYAKNTIVRFPEQSSGFVVEIASNDGTLLKHFQGTAVDVLGIDPAQPTVDKALADGVPTVAKLFSYDTAMKVRTGHGAASIIMANNVVAHTDKLLDFLTGFHYLLDDQGVGIIEVQYFPHLLFNNAFDHLYHEHRSFFSFTSLNNALITAGLTAFSVMESDTQGGSIRVFVQRAKTGKENITPSVDAMIKYEEELGLHDLKTYEGLSSRVRFMKEQLLKILGDLKLQGKTVYGFGASAKGNTLLNTFGIGPELVQCIVDKTPYKIGKYAPGSLIPVVDEKDVPKPDYYLVLVWNYLSGILEREKDFRDKGGKFIVPIPGVIIL